MTTRTAPARVAQGRRLAPHRWRILGWWDPENYTFLCRLCNDVSTLTYPSIQRAADRARWHLLFAHAPIDPDMLQEAIHEPPC